MRAGGHHGDKYNKSRYPNGTIRTYVVLINFSKEGCCLPLQLGIINKEVYWSFEIYCVISCLKCLVLTKVTLRKGHSLHLLVKIPCFDKKTSIRKIDVSHETGLHFF